MENKTTEKLTTDLEQYLEKISMIYEELKSRNEDIQQHTLDSIEGLGEYQLFKEVFKTMF